jgi:hypothetical protein
MDLWLVNLLVMKLKKVLKQGEITQIFLGDAYLWLGPLRTRVKGKHVFTECAVWEKYAVLYGGNQKSTKTISTVKI